MFTPVTKLLSIASISIYAISHHNLLVVWFFIIIGILECVHSNWVLEFSEEKIAAVAIGCIYALSKQT